VNINNIIRARISTLDVRSFVPAWTTLAADCAAEAATRDKCPNPCESKQKLRCLCIPMEYRAQSM